MTAALIKPLLRWDKISLAPCKLFDCPAKSTVFVIGGCHTPPHPPPRFSPLAVKVKKKYQNFLLKQLSSLWSPAFSKMFLYSKFRFLVILNTTDIKITWALPVFFISLHLLAKISRTQNKEGLCLGQSSPQIIFVLSQGDWFHL